MEYVFLAIFFLMVGSNLAWLLMILFHREHIIRLDEITVGRRIIADSFPYRVFRATDYGFACTFDVIARRAHPSVDFSSIPRALKRPFRVICVLLLVGLSCLAVGSVWAGVR